MFCFRLKQTMEVCCVHIPYIYVDGQVSLVRFETAAYIYQYIDIAIGGHRSLKI